MRWHGHALRREEEYADEHEAARKEWKCVEESVEDQMKMDS